MPEVFKEDPELWRDNVDVDLDTDDAFVDDFEQPEIKENLTRLILHFEKL